MTFVPPRRSTQAEKAAINAALTYATTDMNLPAELREEAKRVLRLSDGPEWIDPTGPRPTRQRKPADN